MRKRTILSILAPLALFLACEKQPETTIVPVTGITLKPTSLELLDGESVTITAFISPSDATNTQVQWTSDNPSILVSNGKITTSFQPGAAITTVGDKQVLGQGIITATTEDGGKKATCQVTILARKIAVTGVSLSEQTLQLYKGESRILNATVNPDNATDKTVNWDSSDESVASVDQSGKVTAIHSGSTTITASIGKFSATCAVTVPEEFVQLNKASLSLEKGASETLTATVSLGNSVDKTVKWDSSNPYVASVDQNGKVTAVGGGVATISASAGGLKATCSVTVSVPVTSISLKRTSLTLAKGASIKLTAIITPEDATEKDIRWSSDNTSVATVNQDGQVTAVNTGNATITASVGGYSATCTVTVNIPVTSISLNPTNLTLLVGETALLEATILPEDATDKTVIWSSSNPDVITVNEGRITAVSVGTAIIWARSGNESTYCTVLVVTDSPSGVTAGFYGGASSIVDGFIQPGDYLDFGVTNLSSETITVKTVQLFDGENGNGAEIQSLDNNLDPGVTIKWRIDVPDTGIHSPTAVFTYTFRGEEYTCSAKYAPMVLVRRP